MRWGSPQERSLPREVPTSPSPSLTRWVPSLSPASGRRGQLSAPIERTRRSPRAVVHGAAQAGSLPDLSCHTGEDLDPMWRPIAPSPQNEGVVLGCRTRGKTWHEDASVAFLIEPPGDVPRRRLPSLRQQAEPGTGHVLQAYTMVCPTFGGPKVRDVFASAMVRAQDARLDLACTPGLPP